MYEDREYCFPINEETTGCHLHGSLQCQEFTVIESEDDFVKLAAEAEYPCFTHKFRVEIDYRLSQTRVE